MGQLRKDFDISKMFVWDNRYQTEQMNQSDYGTLELPAGRVLGRIASTKEIVPHDSAASDGSQYPVGVLADNYDIEEGDTIDVSMCIGGDVVEDKIVLADGDTLDTVIEGRTIRDRLMADTLGIKVVPSTNLTHFDN